MGCSEGRVGQRPRPHRRPRPERLADGEEHQRYDAHQYYADDPEGLGGGTAPREPRATYGPASPTLGVVGLGCDGRNVRLPGGTLPLTLSLWQCGLPPDCAMWLRPRQPISHVLYVTRSVIRCRAREWIQRRRHVQQSRGLRA